MSEPGQGEPTSAVSISAASVSAVQSGGVPGDAALSIQAAAQFTGLSIDTLRYYERVGLLEPVSRHSSGHRRYHPGDLHRVGFLSCLRATGMGIRQLQAFTALSARGQDDLEARLALLEAHKVQVRAKIAALEEALNVIDHKISHYRAERTSSRNTLHGGHL